MSTQDDTPSTFGQFFAEMRRRHVVRFAIGYAAAAFVVLQLAEIVFPAFGLGDDWLRVLVIGVALGFPPALLVAWVFDITPQGIRRTVQAPAGHNVGPLLPRLSLMVATFLVVGGLALWMAGAVTSEGGASFSGETAPTDAVTLASYDPAEPIRSIAVLPLDDFSPDGQQDYFTAGMQEELIAQLSQISGLRVVSRTSVARYAGTTTAMPVIGAELGVDAVIEGSVRRDDERMRITIQLIHAASDSHIWSEQYDRELVDVLALQSEVALEIAKAIQGELSPEEESVLQRTAARDVDPAAADEYFRGKYEAEKGTAEGYQAALEHFRSAVEHDSAFAPAMAGLAGARLLLSMATGDAFSEADLGRAREEAAMALNMDSTSVEARDVWAIIEQSVAEALDPLSEGGEPPAVDAPRGLRVIRIPGVQDSIVVDVEAGDQGWGTALSQMGRQIEERVRMRSVDVEREGDAMRFFSARQLMSTGQFDGAIGILEDVVEDSPDNVPAWEMLIRSELAAGDVDDAVYVVSVWSETAAEGAPSAQDAEALADAVDASGTDGLWTWTLGRLDAQRKAGQPVSLLDYASAYAGLGDGERAFSFLEQAVQQGDRRVGSLHSDPVWDDLRSDHRFEEAMRAARHVRFPPQGKRPRDPGMLR